MRAAVFTTSPMTVYSRFSREPTDARDHISAVDADAHIEGRQALAFAVPRCNTADAIAQGDRGNDGIHRVPGIAFRRAEDGHDPIANKLGARDRHGA